MRKQVALTLFNNKVLNLAVFAQDYIIKPRIYSCVSVSVLALECEALGKMAKATKECVSTEETTLFFLRNFVSHCLHVGLLSLDLWWCVSMCVCLPVWCFSPGYHRNAAALGRAVADWVAIGLHHLHGLLHCSPPPPGRCAQWTGKLSTGHQVWTQCTH